MSDWFARLPKVELHLHLEGAIPHTALWELVQKYGGDASVPNPEALAERKLGGTVTLWVLVRADGGVEDVRVLRGSEYGELDRAATDALRRASYRAARRDGVAVPTWTQLKIVFRLD